MFTRNIRTQVLLGKSGVKWDVPSETQRALESLNRDNNIADLLKRAENTRDEAIRFQTVDGDPIKAGHALERFADILKKVNTKNASDRNAVIASIDALIAAAPDGSALKTKATELKTSFEKSYEGAAAKETGWASTAKADTKKEMSRTMESVIQKNSRETQARDFTEYVASKLFDPIKSNFLDAVIKKDEMGKVTYELTNVSIPNLLRSIYEGTPYVADGAEFNDRYALKKFMEVYNNKESVFNTVLIPLAVAARAGQSVESVRKSGTLTASANNSAVIQYLTQVDNFETQGITALDRQLSAATVFAFNKVKGDDDKFLKVLQNALILGGSTESFSDLPTLKTALTTKPELKYAILAGIREAARSPGGIESLHDTKTASGIGENERKMLETLDTNKIKLLDGLKKGFTSQLEEQIKDGTIPALKKEEAQKSIDAYIADMKRDGSVGWNIVSKNLGAAITNRGAGAGAGATMDFPPNWLADNVSMGI